MSKRLIDAAEAYCHPERTPTLPFGVLAREAVATLGWGTMTYACKECGFEWRVWLALGVEGPRALRDAKLFVASPFSGGRCPAWPVRADAPAADRATFRHLTQCDGQMAHVRFNEDQEFEPRLMPDDVPRFVLARGYEHAALVVPEPALVAARRFHADREEAGQS